MRHTVVNPFKKKPTNFLVNFHSENNETTLNFIELKCFDKIQIKKIIDLNLFFKGYYIQYEYVGEQYRSVNFSKQVEDETFLFEKIISILNVQVNPLINCISISFSNDIFNNENVINRIN